MNARQQQAAARLPHLNKWLNCFLAPSAVSVACNPVMLPGEEPPRDRQGQEQLPNPSSVQEPHAQRLEEWALQNRRMMCWNTNIQYHRLYLVTNKPVYAQHCDGTAVHAWAMQVQPQAVQCYLGAGPAQCHMAAGVVGFD